MASKEATVYIVDCGSTMGERSHGRKQTNLDFALEYVWDRITATIATGRKTAMAGVVGLRTDGTRNDLNGEDDYAHITVFQDISQMLMSQVRKLRNELVLSSTPGGDAISAIIVAIQMIAKECKKLKYERKIVLVTDARGPMQTDDLSDIIPKLKEDEIQLVVIGVDFDDAEYGFKEENKDATKGENEAGLRQICSDCGGAFGTLAQAVDELGIPRVKSTKPVASYKGFLTLGNPEQYETAMAIDIERYPKIMAATTPSASKFVVRSDMGDATQSTMTMNGEDGQNGSNDGLAAVKTAMTYQVVDTNAPGGKRDVDRDELSKGYEYGRTAVHISESDRNVTTYETTPGLDVVGFVDKNQYERYLDMSRAHLIIGQREFGTSEFVPKDDLPSMLTSCFHQPFSKQNATQTGPTAEEKRTIVLLGHDINQDITYLHSIGFSVLNRSNLAEVLDTATMFKSYTRDNNATSLGKVLYHFDIDVWNLHNAGNDAVYTMQAMLAIAVQAATEIESAEAERKVEEVLEKRTADAAELAKQKVEDEAEGWSLHGDEEDGYGATPLTEEEELESKQGAAKKPVFGPPRPGLYTMGGVPLDV
ncbi:ATP-dependent DNA helicase yku80 [Friedmanniomyces endolithicus]|nr:ATP-dependent DNA helicase yku80 [Friedmanniomyces endolithicus]